tara:strand:+ start:870 stop:2249 length:1380 start_codon:yes stop_codon:yes gene_type:complete
MAIKSKAAEVEVSFAIIRDGAKVTNDKGKYELIEYLQAWEIFESIQSATIEASFIINDSGGLINRLTGSEEFQIQLKTPEEKRSYIFRSYEIVNRVRGTQTGEMYRINATSNEFIKNEVLNVFGHTEKIFKGSVEASKIIKTLLKGKKYIGSTKKVFLEETMNKQTMVVPNWRPIDFIYWMCSRSIRKSKKGGSLQNGFLFWESSLGFNFQSVDKMVEDVNDQKSKKTDREKGTARLYEYVYTPKSTADSGESDPFTIDTVVFPDEKSYLMGLRHGTWAGYSIGFDPVNIAKSKVGGSKDFSQAEFKYGVTPLWKKMSHVGGTKNINPINTMDSAIKNIINFPKRVRYTMMPNQIFDPKYQSNPQANYSELVELQAYQWLRLETIRNIKLSITIPGNLDLFAGKGVSIKIPSTEKVGSAPILDKKYSGRYLIGGVAHTSSGDGASYKTELMLMKDTISN